MDLDLLFSSLVAGLHGRKITQQRMVYEPLRDAILEALFFDNVPNRYRTP